MKNRNYDYEKMTAEDYIIEKQYQRAVADLKAFQQKRNGKAGRNLAIIVFSISSLMCMMLLEELNYESVLYNALMSLIISGFITAFISAYMGLFFEIKESSLRRRVLEYGAESIQESVEEDFFENSLKMSYKYLDQYYLQTREQAQRGFLVTVCVAIFGAILIAVGIIAMYFNSTEPPIITCASGIIIEFISAIFFYLYNRTISSMSQYHNKLVMSQNISIALKLAESLPEQDKVKTKDFIVTELLKNINNHLVKSDVPVK